MSPHPTTRSSRTPHSASLNVADINKASTPTLGACNPPRRAKRSRYNDIPNPNPRLSPPLSPAHQLSPVLSASPSAAAADPTSTMTATSINNTNANNNSNKKRANGSRKSGALSRAAREAQRKMNHSLIEKARRTKINDALAMLRTLVPRDDHPAAAADNDDDQNDGDDDASAHYPNKRRHRDHASAGALASSSSSPSAEREFKLEILERAVAYLQELVGRVKELEKAVAANVNNSNSGSNVSDNICRNCSAVVAAAAADAPTKKRKLVISRTQEGPDGGYEADNDNNDDDPTGGGGQHTTAKTTTVTTPQLPPISSWLPDHRHRHQSHMRSSVDRHDPAGAGSAHPLTPSWSSPEAHPQQQQHALYTHGQPPPHPHGSPPYAPLSAASPLSSSSTSHGPSMVLVLRQTPPPALTLPSPSLEPCTVVDRHQQHHQQQQQQQQQQQALRHQHQHAPCSPKGWHHYHTPPSPEDRSAATLLLQIASSSSSSSASSSSALAPASTASVISTSPDMKLPHAVFHGVPVKPHTPSSILGLVLDD